MPERPTRKTYTFIKFFFHRLDEFLSFLFLFLLFCRCTRVWVRVAIQIPAYMHSQFWHETTNLASVEQPLPLCLSTVHHFIQHEKSQSIIWTYPASLLVMDCWESGISSIAESSSSSCWDWIVTFLEVLERFELVIFSMIKTAVMFSFSSQQGK